MTEQQHAPGWISRRGMVALLLSLGATGALAVYLSHKVEDASDRAT